ncbi:unnamed protein product [Nezara viridula]|uniref:Uncharacterized protein n=1 Tax=Nezara viridula TaxID=85310 RepID=A0A9P0H2K1_NEZVI|nr:unnamed protein product [Nezara viridula]
MTAITFLNLLTTWFLLNIFILTLIALSIKIISFRKMSILHNLSSYLILLSYKLSFSLLFVVLQTRNKI